MRTSPHRTVTSSRRFGAVALVVGALLVAACGSDSNSGSPGGTGDTAGSSGAPATTTAGGTDAPATTGAGSGRTSLVIGSTLAPPTLDITTGSGAAIPAALALQRVRDVREDRRRRASTNRSWRRSTRSPTTGSPTPSTCSQGVTFQNGEPFDSSDVKFSFDNSIANIAKGTAPAIISADVRTGRLGRRARCRTRSW